MVAGLRDLASEHHSDPPLFQAGRCGDILQRLLGTAQPLHHVGKMVHRRIVTRYIASLSSPLGGWLLFNALTIAMMGVGALSFCTLAELIQPDRFAELAGLAWLVIAFVSIICAMLTFAGLLHLLRRR